MKFLLCAHIKEQGVNVVWYFNYRHFRILMGKAEKKYVLSEAIKLSQYVIYILQIAKRYKSPCFSKVLLIKLC